MLGSEETDRGNRKRVGSDWCSLGACMSVYLTVSVYSAVFSLLSLSLSVVQLSEHRLQECVS